MKDGQIYDGLEALFIQASGLSNIEYRVLCIKYWLKVTTGNIKPERIRDINV